MNRFHDLLAKLRTVQAGLSPQLEALAQMSGSLEGMIAEFGDGARGTSLEAFGDALREAKSAAWAMSAALGGLVSAAEKVSLDTARIAAQREMRSWMRR